LVPGSCAGSCTNLDKAGGHNIVSIGPKGSGSGPESLHHHEQQVLGLLTPDPVVRFLDSLQTTPSGSRSGSAAVLLDTVVPVDNPAARTPLSLMSPASSSQHQHVARPADVATLAGWQLGQLVDLESPLLNYGSSAAEMDDDDDDDDDGDDEEEDEVLSRSNAARPSSRNLLLAAGGNLGSVKSGIDRLAADDAAKGWQLAWQWSREDGEFKRVFLHHHHHHHPHHHHHQDVNGSSMSSLPRSVVGGMVRHASALVATPAQSLRRLGIAGPAVARPATSRRGPAWSEMAEPSVKHGLFIGCTLQFLQQVGWLVVGWKTPDRLGAPVSHCKFLKRPSRR
jgi:hypothetical protein